MLTLLDVSDGNETLAALQQARAALKNHGVSFAALGAATLEKADKQNRTLLAEREIDRLRRESASLTRTLNQAKAESERWRMLAREMADQLFEMNQMLESRPDRESGAA